jgi:hypothetical protein
MIIIRHLSGPLAGKEQRIEPQSDHITFGRDPSVCDVVFPPDLTIVARRHFALVRTPAGEWTFQLFGDPFVAVKGEPAEMGAAVHSGDTVELGRAGGPSFEIVLQNEGLGDQLLKTAPQQAVESSHVAAKRANRLAAVAAVIAILGVGAAGGFTYWNRLESTRLDRAFTELSDAQKRTVTENIPSALTEKLMAAAYVVVLRFASGQETADGTASPIAADTLATNAHIVELFEKLTPGEKMFVRAPGPNGKTYEVIETKRHPGYKAFNTFLSSDPIYVTSSKSCPKCFPDVLSGSLSYDVGILKVAPNSNLSPILEIATPAELADLKTGTPLAMAGYPVENIQGYEVQTLGATPNLSLGIVTAMTDMFNLPAEPGMRRLIHHNLPITGGSSGSPMLAPNGKLVALNNAMNALTGNRGSRIPNAALINYAQRADQLLDLLSGRADQQLAEDRVYWATQTANFKRGFDFLVQQILVEMKPSDGATATMVSQNKFTLDAADQVKNRDSNGKEIVRRPKKIIVPLKGGQDNVLIAYAQESAAIKMFVMVDGKIVIKDDRDQVWYPNVSYKPASDVQAEVYVVGDDADVNYTLLQYNWTAPPS